MVFYDKATAQWIPLSDVVVDKGVHSISGKSSHFTAMGVIAYTHPAVFKLGSLIISPTELKIGESVSISVNIDNTGDLAGTYNVRAKAKDVNYATSHWCDPIVLTVVAVFGLISSPLFPIVIVLSFVGGLMFASIAMCFTAIAPNIDFFNYPSFLLITPMFLLSGTFFPIVAIA
jgi:hypothetical protein